MTSLASHPVLLALAARATTLRVIHTATVLDATAQEASRAAFRAKDAARKRRERRWNRILGRRADGHVIRPIPPAGRSRYGVALLRVAA